MSDLREKILPCATDLYLEHGLKGLSMRILAERLGVSATAIYRHYRNKEDLLHSIIGEAIKVFGSYLFPALSGANAIERFHLGEKAYLDFALEQSKYYEVLFLSAEQLGEDEHPEELRKKSLATFQFLVDRVQECIECKYLQKGDPFEIAMTIWAHSHGLISIYLGKKTPLEEVAFRELFYASNRRLLNGLGNETK